MLRHGRAAKITKSLYVFWLISININVLHNHGMLMKIKNQEINHECTIIKTTVDLFLILLGFGLTSLFVPVSNSGSHIAFSCPTWESLSLSLSLTTLIFLNDNGQNWVWWYTPINPNTQEAEADWPQLWYPASKKLVSYFIKYLSTWIYLRLSYD